MEEFQQPLAIVFVWHPENSSYLKPLIEYMVSLFSQDAHNPFLRSMHLPVFYQTSWNKGMPKDLMLDAEKKIFFVFVSIDMIANDDWKNYIKKLEREEENVIPIALDDKALCASKWFGNKNFIREYEFSKSEVKYRLFISVAHEIYRHALNGDDDNSKLGKDCALKIFLSHAKDGAEGIKIARALKEYIDQGVMRSFFDATDIAPGYRFDKEIEGHIKKSTIIAIHSDIYSSRYWCQREIICAKENDRPMVGVDALSNIEDRQFTYASNIPFIHVGSDIDQQKLLRILVLALLETIRFYYAGKLLKAYKAAGLFDENAKLTCRPPEFCDMHKWKGHGKDDKVLVMYPDPPIYEEELMNMRALGIDCKTPLLCDGSLLKNKRIGISVSEPSNEELLNLGQDSDHLRHLSQELARYLLAREATLVYGGDLRKGGFTEFLFNEAMVLQTRLQSEEIHIENYLAWPLYNHDTEEVKRWKAEYCNIVKMLEVPRAADIEDIVCVGKNQFLPKSNLVSRFIWASCFTEMREVMIDKCDVRICAGGRYFGYSSFMPGVLEEIKIAVEKGKPIYLLGGFGGVTKCVCDYITTGKLPEELTMEWQINHNVGYGDLLDYAKSRNKANLVDYAKLMQSIRTAFSKPNNGLGPDENKKLFETPYVNEAVYLILKGMKRCLK